MRIEDRGPRTEGRELMPPRASGAAIVCGGGVNLHPSAQACAPGTPRSEAAEPEQIMAAPKRAAIYCRCSIKDTSYTAIGSGDDPIVLTINSYGPGANTSLAIGAMTAALPSAVPARRPLRSHSKSPVVHDRSR